MEDDSIIEALDKIKDWAMGHMLKNGDKPPEGAELDGEGAPELEEELGAESLDEPEADDDFEAPPKRTVMKSYDFAGAKPAPKPSALPEEEEKRFTPRNKRRF